jgi:hypothetical protein
MKNFFLILITITITLLTGYKFHFHILKFKNKILNLISQQSSKEIKSSLETVYLNLDSTEFNKLLGYRKSAFLNAYISPKEKKNVKGEVKINDKIYKAKIKLSGHAWDHLGGDGLSKTSLTIHIPNRAKFSLRHPTTRSYLYEWILHKALEKRKIPTTKYSFKQLSINGKKKGIYSIEKRFQYDFFKDNNIEEGLVLQFDFYPTLIENMLQTKYVSFKSFNNINNFNNCKILNYKSNIDSLEYHKKLAYDKLDSFRINADTNLSDFDLKSWAEFFSVLEIFGANHAASWPAIRFYYNLNTKKFFPVGYDGAELKEKSLLHFAFDDSPVMISKLNEIFLRKFFKNISFMKLYNREINNLLNNDFVNKVFMDNEDEYGFLKKELKKEFNYNEKYWYNEEFAFDPDLKEKLEIRSKYLKTVYNPAQQLCVFYKDNEIFAGNKYYLPIKLIGLKNNSNTETKNIILKQKSSKSPIELTKISTNLSLDKNLKILYKKIGDDSVFIDKIFDFYKTK